MLKIYEHTQAQIKRRGVPTHVSAIVKNAGLDPARVHGVGRQDLHPKRRPRRHKVGPKRQAIHIRIHVIDLKAQLAGPACPANQNALSADRNLPRVVILEPLGCATIDASIEDIQAFWSLNLDRPSLRVTNLHVVANLQSVQPCEHIPIRVHVPEPVFGQTEHHTITGDASIIVAHQPIAAPIDGHGADLSGEDEIQKCRRVWATNFQRAFGHIKDTRLSAQNAIFIGNSALKDHGCQPPFVISVSRRQISRRLKPG